VEYASGMKKPTQSNGAPEAASDIEVTAFLQEWKSDANQRAVDIKNEKSRIGKLHTLFGRTGNTPSHSGR
jgi:hypothetical protein